MLQENLKYFYDNYDFDMLEAWFSVADPVAIALNPFVFVPVIIVFAMFYSNKTIDLAQRLIVYVPALGYLFVTFVILKNDIISGTGPFIMSMIAFFMIVGWLLWTKLLKS
ncbi:hypothetical protein MNBD_NITROSPINAE01-1588 [hydrothermal vent metagenome]|uniref:Uncharacterized protein n=1 Tax=hydrothermal vent metagenome TaxID=652676 RepID=A0A3B1C728_9ZZZZ